MDLPDLLRTVLPYPCPPEQAIYLRLGHLAGGQGTCNVRYDDPCRSAHVSTSTLKRALKVLSHKKLLNVTFQAKQATQFGNVLQLSITRGEMVIVSGQEAAAKSDRVFERRQDEGSSS